MRLYRVNGTRKVWQEPKYLDKEVARDGERITQSPKERYSVRSSFDTAAHIMYSTTGK